MEPYNIKLESDQMQSAEGIMADPAGKILSSPTMIDEPAMHTVVNPISRR